MKKTLPNRIFPHIPEAVTAVFELLRAEGFSSAQIGDIFGVVPEQNIAIGITLPQKNW